MHFHNCNKLLFHLNKNSFTNVETYIHNLQYNMLNCPLSSAVPNFIYPPAWIDFKSYKDKYLEMLTSVGRLFIGLFKYGPTTTFFHSCGLKDY